MTQKQWSLLGTISLALGASVLAFPPLIVVYGFLLTMGVVFIGGGLLFGFLMRLASRAYHWEPPRPPVQTLPSAPAPLAPVLPAPVPVVSPEPTRRERYDALVRQYNDDLNFIDRSPLPDQLRTSLKNERLADLTQRIQELMDKNGR